MAHPYFDGLDFDLVEAGEIPRECIATCPIPDILADSRHADDYQSEFDFSFRVDPAHRDLTFDAWHRGLDGGLNGYDPECVFDEVRDKNGVVLASHWLRDNEHVVAQMNEGSLPNFEYPSQKRSCAAVQPMYD